MPADPAALSAHAETLGGYIELWQMLGLRVLLPFYLTTHGALLAAAGDLDGARAALRGVARDWPRETGMRFYDAETMRRWRTSPSDRDAVASAAARRPSTSPVPRPRGPSSCASRSTCTTCWAHDARPLLERAMRAFGDGAATGDLEEARARVTTPR